MSEKRAKAALKAYYKPCVTDCQCPACRTVESIIATDPDLDRLVEWLQQDEGDYVGGEMQFSVIRVSRLFDHIREMKEQP